MGLLDDIFRFLGLVEDAPKPAAEPPRQEPATATRPAALARQDLLHGIDYLYHLTHIGNLPGILDRGLLSHNMAHRSAAFTDISDRNVNDRRSWMTIAGTPLHDYAPLYFNPTNPMLFRRREIQDSIAILAFSKELLYRDDVLFSDGNAAANATAFFSDLTNLSRVDWECVWGEYWNDHVDGRRKRCAEVLVPDGIHPSWIQKIIVRNAAARHQVLRSVRADLAIEIQPWRYF